MEEGMSTRLCLWTSGHVASSPVFLAICGYFCGNNFFISAYLNMHQWTIFEKLATWSLGGLKHEYKLGRSHATKPKIFLLAKMFDIFLFAKALESTEDVVKHTHPIPQLNNKLIHSWGGERS